ncbi:helix-turn-helix domain-containing protein [Fluviicola chungangensis]|uniref:Helix-turn-helix transcriptional regulator n=1 Tax=Fluviicola chungangensis TaxID=2597671 RepID=A0A556MY39_9FLAO|nr:helix-turn-helix transcriptional regulator [Fluviicola chungangensis]TSJ44825.1 helix-turn-helix transcriptional regulator [Fluviicola chungangensis]
MNDEIVVSHAKKLRYLRKKSDRTQVEVASHLGLSQQAYSKLEQGETTFSDETIEKIAEFFKITPAEFENTDGTITVSSNNSNNTHSNNSIDDKLLETFVKIYEQNSILIERNKEIVNDLMIEKDKRIQLLEELLKTKKEY